MSQVFISYSKKDYAVAEQLAQKLSARGFNVWWDFQLYSGDDFHDVIRAEIHKSSAVIVIWSEAAVASQWVRGEAQEAHDLGRLVPAHVQGFDPKRVPLNFRALHIESVESFESLVRAIQRQDALASSQVGLTPTEEAELFEKAARMSNPFSPKVMEEEQAKTVRLLRSLVRQGNAKAHGALADLYFNGKGVPQDSQEALRLYKLAGDKGMTWAYQKAGNMLRSGRSGVPQDHTAAYHCFRRAFEGGLVSAALALAGVFETGEGAQKNEHEALRYYRIYHQKFPISSVNVADKIAKLEAKLGKS